MWSTSTADGGGRMDVGWGWTISTRRVTPEPGPCVPVTTDLQEPNVVDPRFSMVDLETLVVTATGTAVATASA